MLDLQQLLTSYNKYIRQFSSMLAKGIDQTHLGLPEAEPFQDIV